jgi:HAD superfamily hydrolase (TIGR01509 family)
MSAASQPPVSIRAVVFDLDGLMFNTEELYQQVGTELLRRRGKRFTPQLLDKMMGRQPHVALQIMIDSHELDDSAEDLAAESQDIFSGILDSQLQCMPGLLQLLTSLEKAGLRKAIATSSRRSFTQRVLGQFELAPRFEFILTSEDVQEGKPHPEIYRTAAARFGIEPGAMMVLEDSQNGCSAAVAAGAFAVAVPGGHSHMHDFSGAKFIATSLADPRIAAVLGF